MNLRFLLAIAGKEFRHILRDGQTLFIILSLPVIMMFLFGYALKSEMEDAPFVLVDPLPSAQSRQLASALDASRLYALVAVERAGEAAELMQVHRARAVIRLEPDYAKSLEESPIRIMAWIDGSDPATATTLRNALPGFFRNHISGVTGKAIPEIIHVDTRFLYNPEQRSSLFFVPGLMATILAMISALLTSVTVTREKESGTLQNLRISKLHSREIILGKLMPYFVIATATGTLILTVGYYAFDVVVQGSLSFLALATAVYLVANLGIGLLISTVVQKQQHAMLLALGITMMPVIMLSGFVFPLASLPKVLQWLSMVLPATWYLQMVRGVILKASTPEMLAQPFVILGVMAILFLVLASVRFAKEH